MGCNIELKGKNIIIFEMRIKKSPSSLFTLHIGLLSELTA